jgi:Lrp/AsnC family leucine-responsive transcriptional regulator
MSNTLKQTAEIDEIDHRLLQLLQQDASRSNQDLALAAGISAPTCLRRVRRLHSAGLIERQVAILRPEPLADHYGEGLQAILEVTLERQSAQDLDAFEQRAVADVDVSQCWRVSAGPDFVLVIVVRDMPAYQALVQRLLGVQTHVRNVRTFFAVRRAKCNPMVWLPGAPHEARHPRT